VPRRKYGEPPEEEPKPEVYEVTPTRTEPTRPVPEPAPTRREVATKILAKQLKEESAPVFEDPYLAVHRRSTSMQQQFVYENPLTAARLIMSSLPDERLAAVTQAVTSSFEWLRTRDRFLGVPGGLLRARSAALQITDPETRSAALDLLGRIQQLPDSEQQAFYAAITSGVESGDFVRTMGDLFPGLAESRVLTGRGVEFRLTGAEPGDEVQQAQILKVLFPEIGIFVGQESQGLLDRVQRTVDDAFVITPDESVTEAIIDVGEAGLSTLQVPFEYGGRVVGEATGAVPFIGKPIRNLVGGAIRGGFSLLGDITMPVARAATSRVEPEQRDRAAEVVNGLLTLLLLHEASKVSSAFKISRDAPAEISAARLGIIFKNGDIANPKILSLKQTIWKFFDRPVETWLDSRGGKAFLKEIERLEAKDPKSLAGALSNVYGELLPFELRKIIAETPRELRAEAITRYVREPGGETVASQRYAEAGARTARIQELETQGGLLGPREASSSEMGSAIFQRLRKVGRSRGFQDPSSARYSYGPSKKSVWDRAISPISGSLQKLGIDTPLSRKLTADETVAQGVASQAGLESILVETYGRAAVDGPRVKSPERIQQKIVDRQAKGNADYSLADLTDYVAARVEVPRLGDIASAIELLRGKGRILEVEDALSLPKQSGFVGVTVKFQLENGMRVEIQFHTPSTLQAAKANWKLYEQYRQMAPGPEAARLLEQMQRTSANALARDLTTPLALDLAEVARLKLERLSLEQQAEAALLKRPLIEYPRRNILRAALREPTTRIERVMNRVFRPMLGDKTLYDAAKLVDELPNHPVLYGPGEGSPLNWREIDADVAINYLRRAKVPDAQARAFVNALKDVKTAQDFFDWVKDGADLIGRSIPKNTPYEVRQALTRFWQRPAEGRSTQLLPIREGQRVGEPIVPAPDGGAMPSRPTDFAARVTLPDVDLVIEATSAMRRASRTLGPVGFLGYNVPRFIMRFGTGILKAPILVLRLPALITRIQLEQMARITQYGGAESFWPGGVLARRGSRTGIEAPVAEELGGVGNLRDQLYEQRATEFVEKNTSTFRDGVQIPKAAHFEAWADSILKTRADWFDAQFARLGLDVDKMIQWIETHDYAARYMANDQAPLLARAGMDTRAFLERKAEAIRQTVGGDPELLRATHTGTWRREPPDIRRSFAAEDLIDEYSTLREKRASLQEGIRATTRLDREVLSALQRELFETRARMLEIEEVLGPQRIAVGRARGGSIEDAGRLAGELERAWKAGEIEMPATLVLKTRTTEGAGGMRGALRDMGDSYQRFWYSAFKPVSWADMHGTRGSLYYQIAARERQGLRNLGWAEKDATAHAQVTAATKTADIMYDLSARTSLHRSLKDIFWFGPAQTEVLYTWFVKIPSRYYPGLGHLLLAAKGGAALDLLRSMGIIQKDNRGDEVIAVPGLEPLLGLTGTQKLKSFNLVTSGLIPGLSTFPSFALGKMALNQGGLWKEISDILLPYGPDVTLPPRPLVYALETLGADFTLFDKTSSALFGSQYESAKSQAYQIAASELLQRGEAPPRVEDFTSDDMFRAAQRDYLDALESEAQSYFRSMMLIRLFGSTVAPASISVSTKERDAWLKYRTNTIDKKVGEPDEDGEYTDEQWALRRELTDDYRAKHPEAFPYTVSYYEPADEVRYPKYRSAGDDGEFDALYRGEYQAMPADEYIYKMLMLESMRHYSGQRDVALREISPTLDPVEILLNWNKRTAAMDKTWSDMDRYFSLNPEAEEYYRTHRMKLHTAYGIPINTFQADRLAETARALRIIGRQDTGLDAYNQEQIEGAARAVSSLYSATGIFGEPNTDTEKAISYFWENVYGPYRETRNKLFDLAGQFAEAGLDDKAGNIYERLRRFDNEQEPVTHNGITYPTPGEVRWGMLTRQDQKDAIAKWATRPPEWSTDFERDKVYGAKLAFEGAEKYLRTQAKFAEYVDEYIDKHDLSSGSSAYDEFASWADRARVSIAQRFGPEAVQMNELSQGTPYERLSYAGLTNKPLDKLGTLANAIVQRVTSDGYSPRGFSAEATFYKEWLYALVEKRRAQNPELDRALDDLSATMAERGMTYKTGVPLYEALFFGNFLSDFIPDELLAIGSV